MLRDVPGRAACPGGCSRRSPSRGAPRARREAHRHAAIQRTTRNRAQPRHATLKRCSWCLPFRREEGRDEVRGLIPFAGFARELLPPSGGKPVILGAAIVLGLPPFRLDEAFLLELEQGGIEGAVVEREAILTGLLDATCDAVAVQRAKAFECLEDHEGEGALLDFELAHRGVLWDSHITVCSEIRPRKTNLSPRAAALWRPHTRVPGCRFQHIASPGISARVNCHVDPATSRSYTRQTPTREAQMARIVVFVHLTLDGVMQAPARPDEDCRDGFEHGGWAGPYADDPVIGQVVGESMSRTGALLFGRRTYE